MKKGLLFSLALPALVFAVDLQAGVVVVGSLARQTTAQPGETFEGIILLKNTEKDSSEIKAYQTDYRFSADGDSFYEPPGKSSRSNADWISLSPTRITVPPNETVSVHYKGRVPDDPGLKGTYWSMIMIEPAPAASGGGSIATGVALGVQTLVRFGVQVITEIGDSGERNLKIVNRALIHDGGKRSLQLDVENAGERLLIPGAWVELFTNQGVSIGRFEGGRWRIYPGCSVRYQADLSDVPKGSYLALVILDNGDQHVVGAQYELEIEK